MKESIIIGALLIFGGVFVILSNFALVFNIIGGLAILAGILILILNTKRKTIAS